MGYHRRRRPRAPRRRRSRTANTAAICAAYSSLISRNIPMSDAKNNRSGRCRVCDAQISAFMSFGRMPIANGFLTDDEIPNEYFFELAPAFCESMRHVSIIEQPRPDEMFHGKYAFYSSTSRYMQIAFRSIRQGGDGGHRSSDAAIRSSWNSAAMTASCCAIFMSAASVTSASSRRSMSLMSRASRGIRTISAFFDRQLADEIVAEHGRADAMLAANVMCHIPDLPRRGSRRTAPAEARRRLHLRGPLSRRHDRQDRPTTRSTTSMSSSFRRLR